MYKYWNGDDVPRFEYILFYPTLLGQMLYRPFQGGTSFVDLFFLSCVCYVFVRVCLYVLCGHLLGKG